MTALDPAPARTLLSDLASRRAGASRVLHRHGLDFCCHGRVPLDEACAAAGLDPASILAEIDAESRDDPAFDDWEQRSLDSLIEHLLTAFHEAHRAELPELVAMAHKVESVHAGKPDCPRGLAAHLERMSEALESHMQKEEQILFPLIRQGRGSMAAMPVQVMEEEHRDHGENLARLRGLAHDFEPPEEACGTWRALYLRLSELERDLMTHIHLENNILFPRALRS